MKKNLEDKLLQELIDRVIQKDRDIENRHEDTAIKNADKEALIEMTDLSVDEINKIEKDIRLEFRKKPKKIFLLIIVLIILLILSSIFIYKYFISDRSESDQFESNQYKDELVFEENFDDNNSGWKIHDDFIYRKYFEDGKYIFMTNQEGKCFEEKLNFKFPEIFTAEITSTWLGGDYDSYGVIFQTFLHNIYNPNKVSYYIHPENKAFFTCGNSRLDTWVKFPILTDKGKNTHIQKFITRPDPDDGWGARYGRFKYYVNGKHIDDCIFNYPFNANLRVEVCGSQKVSFDHIKITNDKTGKVVLDSPFGDPEDRLETDTEFRAISSVENGQYIFNTDVKGKCFKSVIPLELKNHTKIKLKSTWLDGEDYYYGLVLESDTGNYYAFELKRDGSAGFIKHKDGINVVFVDDIDTGYSSNGEITIEQTVILLGNKLEYYVNDKLVHSENSSRLSINNIGFRVCGRQSVAFDKLEVWE